MVLYSRREDGFHRPEPINFLVDRYPKRKKIIRRRWWFIFMCVFALFFLSGWLFFDRRDVRTEENPLLYDPITLQPLAPPGILGKITHFIFHQDPILKGARRDRINVLILGMGGIGHDGPYLTDTMMIASIKPSTRQIALISIPRDLAVHIPGRGWYKINHANAFGELKGEGEGAALAAKVVADTFHIDIHYYVRVDFTAFEKLIDAVGGVTVVVERAFTDTEFPDAANLYRTLSFREGEQTMNGSRALQYARSRHGNNNEGSDFARGRRQQKVLLALKGKILSFATLTNPLKINTILSTLESHLTTNLSFGEILDFIQLGRELHTDSIISLTLDTGDSGFLRSATGDQGAYMLEPKTGSFDIINAAIATIFDAQETKDDTPTQTSPALTPAHIEVQNGTWIPGLAARVRKTLTDKGFIIEQIGNTGERPAAESGIYMISAASAPDVLQSLQQTLNIPIKQALAESERAATSTDILVIIGENYQE